MRSEWSKRSLLSNFWDCLNSGFVRSLSWFEFFGFGFFVSAEPTCKLLDFFDVLVYSKFRFVRIFWIWFVVFAERTKRAEPTRKSFGAFKFWFIFCVIYVINVCYFNVWKICHVLFLYAIFPVLFGHRTIMNPVKYLAKLNYIMNKNSENLFS